MAEAKTPQTDPNPDEQETAQVEPFALTDELVEQIATRVADKLPAAKVEPARQSGGSTFAERKTAREASVKRISRSQNKAIQGGEEK